MNETNFNKESINPNDFCVIGLGSFGKPFADELGGDSHIDTVKDKNESGEVISYKEIGEICSEIRESTAKVFFVAISTDGVMGEPGKKIYKTIFEKGAVAVDINSVQGSSQKVFQKVLKDLENNEAGLIGLHPMFGPSSMGNNSIKNMITTEKTSNSSEGFENIKKAILQIQSLLSQENGYIYHDLSKKTVEIDEIKFSGADLHDKITSYYQAIVHMIRILSPNNEWFENIIDADINDWHLDLSNGVKNQNPNAVELYKKYFAHIEQITDKESKKAAIMTSVKIAIDEGNRLFKNHDFDFVKTPKFQVLEGKI